MNAPIRIILADDHKMLREGFKTLLKKQPGIQLIAEAENGAVLLDLIDKHLPDVVIADIKMPGFTGIEVCKILRQRHPKIPVIALSGFDSDSLIIDMLEAGAKGYLLKNTGKEQLVQAIRSVYEGGTYFCSDISVQLHKMLAHSKSVTAKISFTPQELIIIQLSARQFTSKEIGAILNLSTRTIDAYKEKMQDKADAKNMIGVIMYALQNDLIKLNEMICFKNAVQ